MSPFKRRGFIGAGLVGLGGVGGVLARKLQPGGVAQTKVPTALDSRFVYDVSEFEKTDPALLLYRPAHEFETGFERVKRLAVAANGEGVWVAGDRAVKRFNLQGKVEQAIQLDRPPHCLHVAGPNELFIGYAGSFEIFDAAGRKQFSSPRFDRNTFLTALTVLGDAVYLADAGSREVLVCDRKTGAIIDQFGKQDPTRNNPGFAVPSPYFDLAAAADGRLRIVNPGRLRVETYSPDGRFESAWGEPGMKIDRFCGCCNPVFFTLTPTGDVITSEKGLARINVYGADGKFKGAVAGPDVLVEDKELAKRACADCRLGAGFDVAVDDQGGVITLDPYRKVVRFFSPNAPA